MKSTLIAAKAELFSTGEFTRKRAMIADAILDHLAASSEPQRVKSIAERLIAIYPWVEDGSGQRAMTLTARLTLASLVKHGAVKMVGNGTAARYSLAERSGV